MPFWKKDFNYYILIVWGVGGGGVGVGGWQKNRKHAEMYYYIEMFHKPGILSETLRPKSYAINNGEMTPGDS